MQMQGTVGSPGPPGWGLGLALLVLLGISPDLAPGAFPLEFYR